MGREWTGDAQCRGWRRFYLQRLQTLAEARRIIGEFIARYNTEWLIERLGHRTPAGAGTAKAAGRAILYLSRVFKKPGPVKPSGVRHKRCRINEFPGSSVGRAPDC